MKANDPVQIQSKRLILMARDCKKQIEATKTGKVLKSIPFCSTLSIGRQSFTLNPDGSTVTTDPKTPIYTDIPCAIAYSHEKVVVICHVWTDVKEGDCVYLETISPCYGFKVNLSGNVIKQFGFNDPDSWMITPDEICFDVYPHDLQIIYLDDNNSSQHDQPPKTTIAP